ncbi:MAG: EamA family transporter, partial [Gammaproteobacteria bacterium]|nr:EamA family transporter [Gammaproteobacteria bacterium]
MAWGRESRALSAALASVALWSTVATAFKLGLAQMAPVQLLFLACVVSLAFFAAVRLVLWRGIAPLSSAVRWRVAALGLVNPLAYY